MYKKIFTRRDLHLFILTASALVGLATASNCAIGQEQKLPQINVTAPRVAHKIVGIGDSGVPIESASVSFQVTISDLDLTKPAGVSELDRRIEAMAKAACSDLDKIFVSPDPRCVAGAIASTGDQKKQVIAAAVAK
jgi:UrcA family protein